MVKRNLCRVLLLALLSPAGAFALGLGDIHLKSTLNAPLDAEIDLVGASAEDLSGLTATLASRDTFRRSGLDYPAFLGTLSFATEKSADGHTMIHVRSADAVHEPFATLLVEVDWARGHVVREYTVLLDPPVFSSENPTNASVAAPSAGTTARTGAVERASAPPPSSSVPSDAAQSAPSAAASAGSAGGGSTYTVHRGDTLSAIATQAYPGGGRADRERALVAIYRANPQAFEGNMNVLRSGSQLSLPPASELTAISPGDAAAEVRSEYQSWGGHGNAAAGASGGSGQLRLVPPQENAAQPAPAAPAASAASSARAEANSAENSALKTRLEQVQTQLQDSQRQLQDSQRQLQDSQRLLQMRNDELAALQARVAQNATKAAAAPPPAPAPKAEAPTPAPAPVATPAANPPVATTPNPTNAAPPPAAPPQTAPATHAPTAKPKVVAHAAPESGNSILDMIAEYWYVPAALIVIVIALLVVRFLRSRQEDEFDRSIGRLQPTLDPTASTVLRAGADTVPIRALPGAREQSYRVEESGTREQPVFDSPEHVSTITTGEHVALDDANAGQPVALDQGDPLAEADFHMAYGLYDQAADLVQIAIQREPTRRDLRLKLLEVFFVWGNKDRFLQSARELSASRDKALPGEWEKIVIMGRQIAPEDALFSTSGALAGAASAGVDLNLEGGQNRVDFDLLGEPSVAAGGHEAAVDLDLSSALGDADPTGEARKISNADDGSVDFVLDDPDRGNDATGSTREMPGGPGSGSGTTATVQIAGGAEADTPTVEQPQLRAGDHPTIRQKIDAATRSGLAGSEQTAELAIDDLGLDLGALDGVTEESPMPGGADAPTMLAGLDEDTRRLLARAEADHGGGHSGEASGAAGPSSTGTWLFTDTDFATVVPPGTKPTGQAGGADAPTQLVTQIATRLSTQISPAPDLDTGSTSRLAKLNPNDDLDLDLGATGQHQEVNGVDLNVGAVDLDVGSASAGEGTFVQTQKIAPGDMPLPELEPATMSEVGTKLDLARAYMDMGDPEGARSILSEVLSEGSVSQKQEARRLMDTLPG